MKNCPNCKAEYEDSAKFCNNCGTELVDSTPAPAVSEAPAPAEKKVNWLFTFLGNILGIFSLFFGGCALAAAELDVNVYYSKYTGNLTGYGYLEVSPASAVFALLFALGTLAFAVINFIQVLVKRVGKEAMFNGICRLTAATALVIYSTVLCANI